MNKTISVLLCKRPDYSRQVLEYLSKAKSIEDWRVHVYIDAPGHQSDFLYHHLKMEDNAQEVLEVAKSFDYVELVQSAPKPLGLKAATLWALKDVFVKQKSDFNLHLEDDILVGPDGLDFIEACQPYITGNIGSVSLQGDCEENLPNYASNQIYAHNYFTCGWGWATTRKFYMSEFMRAPDQGVPASWAINIAKLYESKGFSELRSNARRSKNIGAEKSTHLKGPGLKGIGELNCLDVGDDWTGGSQEPVWKHDFTLLEEKGYKRD